MRYRSNHILALIPQGDDGINVLKQAMFFQESLGMHIFLYRINENQSTFEKLFRTKKIKNQRVLTLQELRDFANQFIPENRQKYFSYRVKNGNQLSVLLNASKKGGYEFIMTEKDGGKNSMEPDDLNRLISLSNTPVMAVSHSHTIKDIKHIVIPVDVLQSTQKKLLWASWFAKQFDAKITIVSVLHLNVSFRHSLAWKNAEKMKHLLTQRGIPCQVEIIKETRKEKHEVILEFIKKTDAGLVIIRTHQESSGKFSQIGSFVSNLVHQCPVPVFTVNSLRFNMPVDFET